ncbi:MAG: UDP-glucose--hexose-1-phosphate uridylyltransferase [Pyrinomonadaceae bacterium]
MLELNLQLDPNRRFNPLTREWVLVSPQRTDRPWQGQVEETTLEIQPDYDPTCYLCPGNARAGGVRNPRYTSTFVFDNDFGALKPDTSGERLDESGLIVAEAERGICRVVCFSPRHDLTISCMSLAEVARVVDTWVAQYQELGALSFINWVQIFENRGALMGASNPHPHCQIWANQHAPNESEKEGLSQTEYYRRSQSCLLCDYLVLEKKSGDRLVSENDHFYALVPFWAVWPFEILVVSKRHMTGLDELSETEKFALADLLKAVTTLYDKLFQVPFPYTMGFHQRPTDGQAHPEWHLHAHFFPPLLRSATIRKFMVGFEMLGMPQRDITAEVAAQQLRAVNEKNEPVEVVELHTHE